MAPYFFEEVSWEYQARDEFRIRPATYTKINFPQSISSDFDKNVK